MLTRLHIASFVGFTIIVWLVALWFQGMSVLNAEFIKPFSTVVGIIAIFVTLFNKYIWSWKIFKGWYVKRPDIRGTWKLEMQSNWINPETNEEVETVYGYAVVRQTLTFLSVRIMTNESRSVLVAHSIERQEDDDLFKLVGVYRNEPKIELQGKRSEIHHGSFALEVHGSPVYELDGHYWTDRATRGSMKLTNRSKTLYDTYNQAEHEFNN